MMTNKWRQLLTIITFTVILFLSTLVITNSRIVIKVDTIPSETYQKQTSVPESAISVHEFRNNDTSSGDNRLDDDLQETFTHAPGDKCVKRLPQAIVIGVMKGGTKALLIYLNKHPYIAACMDPSEPNYFSRYFESKGVAWYKKLMPCSYANQITLEKTPAYFYNDRCPGRIKKTIPSAKLILIVKDPIVRAQSQYEMHKARESSLVGNGTSVPKFEELVFFPNQTKVNPKKYIGGSTYVTFMQNWLKHFNLEQFWFVDGHVFEADPVTELRKLETFLDIPHFFTSDMFIMSKDKGKFCWNEGKGMRCLGRGKGRPHPQLAKKHLRKLQLHFKPLNERFFDVIGRRFDWGY